MEEIKIKGLPKDFFAEMPKAVAVDLDDFVQKIKNATLVTDREREKYLMEIFKKHSEYFFGKKVELHLTIKNKKGEPLPHSKVTIAQTRDEYSMEYDNNRADTVMGTDKDGKVIVKDLPRHHFPLLAKQIVFCEIPRNNHKVTVKAWGYKEKRFEFASVDKKCVAVGMKLAPAYKVFFEEGFTKENKKNKDSGRTGKELKIPERKEDYEIPKAYLSDRITFEIILEERSGEGEAPPKGQARKLAPAHVR
jgi:hypothetical protein